MSKKTALILVIILIVIVVGLGLWWWLGKQGIVTKPTDLLKPAVQPQGVIVNPEASSSEPTLALPADSRTSQEVVLENLVRNFVERAASYSAITLLEAKQAVAALPVSQTVVNQLIVPLPKPWQAVESRVLRIEPTKVEANAATFTVNVQRQWQGVSQEAVNYHTMIVTVQSTSGNWQVTQAQWQ